MSAKCNFRTLAVAVTLATLGLIGSPIRHAAAANNLGYHGGPIMLNPIRAYIVYWLPAGVVLDTSVSDGVGNFETLTQQFFNDVPASLYFNIAPQYYSYSITCPSSNQTSSGSLLPACQVQDVAGAVKLGGSWVDRQAYPGNKGTAANPLQDSDIQAEVTRAIDQNRWSVDTNTIIFVITGVFEKTGAGVVECNGSQCTLPGGFCGYHDNYLGGAQRNQATFYAYLSDASYNSGGCGENLSAPVTGQLSSDREVALMSHEFFESVTDPWLNAWYDQSSGNEIGDNCNQIGANATMAESNYWVQEQWSNASSSCITTFPAPIQVYELRLQGSWQQANLSAIVSNKPAAFPAAGGPFAYVTPDKIPRIVYWGTDDHIHELRLQGSWQQADLSATVSNKPPAFPVAGNPFAYVTRTDNIPRVIYRGGDNHIHELRLQGTWQQADLSTGVSNSPPAFPMAGAPFAYVTADNIPRIVYRGEDSHIHELRLEGSWQQSDLSASVSNSPPAFPAAGNPVAYEAPDNIPRVVYRGTDNHLHELRLQGSWQQADLSTAVTNKPPAFPVASDPFAQPFAYVSADKIPRIVYLGDDNHIHELRLQGSWQQADLSATVSNSPPAFPAAGNPFAYVDDNNIARVVYKGSDNHVHELRLQGSWQQADLSAIVGNSPPAFPTLDVSPVFAYMGSVPRVLYIGASH